MADVVNLRLARKRRRRADKQAAADESRIRSGRSREERARLDLERQFSARRLDGHRRSPVGSADPDPGSE